MPANNTGCRTGYLAGRFPGKLGHLFSPGAERGPLEFMRYALDNGAYGAFTSGSEWDEAAWMRLLDWANISGQLPLWAIVPDVVGNKTATLRNWSRHAATVARYGWPLAFAVQDGMLPADVPSDAEVIFVGGTTDWKWATVGLWCASFPRVHVGRVNTYRRLWQCHDLGAESVDGTGWMRGDQVQYRGLLAYLEESTGGAERVMQLEMAVGAEERDGRIGMSGEMKCKCGRSIHENFGDQRMYYGRYNHVDENGQRDSKHYWHKAEPEATHD